MAHESKDHEEQPLLNGGSPSSMSAGADDVQTLPEVKLEVKNGKKPRIWILPLNPQQAQPVRGASSTGKSGASSSDPGYGYRSPPDGSPPDGSSPDGSPPSSRRTSDLGAALPSPAISPFAALSVAASSDQNASREEKRRSNLFEVSSPHVDHLKEKSSSGEARRYLMAFLSIDAILTLIRVGDQRFFNLLGVGDHNGPLTELAGSNVPVALAVMYWALATPTANLYLAHKEGQHAEYSNNPHLLLKFLEEFLEKAKGNLEQQSEQQIVDTLCPQIQRYFDELFCSNLALQTKYESLKFKYSKENGQYQFYIYLTEKAPKPEPVLQSSAKPSCNLFLVPDIDVFKNFKDYIHHCPAYCLTPKGLFYLHSDADEPRALIKLREDKSADDKAAQVKLAQIRELFGVQGQTFATLAKEQRFDHVSDNVSSEQQAAIARLTNCSPIPCYLHSKDPGLAASPRAYILKEEEGDNVLYYRAQGEEQRVKILNQRQAQLTRELIKQAKNRELTAVELLQITAMTGHHLIPQTPQPKTFFQKVEEYVSTGKLKILVSFCSHAFMALFTAFLFFWLAWISGSLVTGNSADLVIQGSFGISMAFVFILPLAIASYIYGKKLFNWLEHHYQFGNTVHKLEPFPTSEVIQSKKMYHCYVYTGDQLFYLNGKGESSAVPVDNRQAFRRKLNDMMGTEESRYFSQEELEELIAKNGGQLQPGAPTVISRWINGKILPGRGFLPLFVNSIWRFFKGLFLLNPLVLLIIGLIYKIGGTTREKDHVFTAEVQPHMVSIFRGGGILAQYDEVAEKIQLPAGKEVPELKQKLLTDSVPPAPPLTMPGKWAVARQFWVVLITKLAHLEFLAWFFMAGVAYVTTAMEDSARGISINKDFSGSWTAAWVFAMVALAYAVWKTWDWYNTQKTDVERLNNAPERDIEAAEVDGLKSQLLELETRILPWKTKYKQDFQAANPEMTPEAVEQALKKHPRYNPGIIDATDADNLANLKDPSLPTSLIERVANGAYVLGLTALLGVFADALFPGRNFFLSGTGVSTPLLQTVFNYLLIPLGLGPVSGFATLVLIALTVGYALLHTYLRVTRDRADAAHKKAKQQRELAPLQITCLQKQIQVLQKQQISLEHGGRPTALAADGSSVVECSPVSGRSLSLSSTDNEEKAPLVKASNLSSAILPISSEDFPEAEFTNSIIERNNRHSRIYLIAWVALAGMFGLFAVSFVPAFFAILSSKLILTICAPIVALSIFALFWHLYYELPLLSDREKNNAVILYLGLIISLACLTLIYTAPPALASVSILFVILPALVTAVLFAINFNKETDGIVYAREFLEQWKYEIKAIINPAARVATWLAPEQKQCLEYALDAVIMAINPNDKGQAIDADGWDKGRENGLLLDIKHLQRIRDRVHHNEALSVEDLDRIKLIFQRFKECPLLPAKTIAANSLLPRKTSAAVVEKVDSNCALFIFILAAIGIILPAALGVYGAWQVTLAVVIPFLVFLKLLVEHAKLDKNYLEVLEGKSEGVKFLVRIAFAILLLAAISAFILPFMFPIHLLAKILLPIIAMAATPVFSKLFLDAWGVSADRMNQLKSGISKIFSPRSLTKLVLSMLFLGGAVGIPASLIFAALNFSSPLILAYLLFFPLSIIVLQLSHKYLKVVFDSKALPVANQPVAADLSTWDSIVAWWVSVATSPKLTSFFLMLNLAVLVLLAIGLPLVSTLLLLNVIVPSATVGVVIVACALPLTFFIFKELLPNVLVALYTKGAGGDPHQNETQKNQIKAGWKYVAYIFSAVIFVAAGILSLTTNLPVHFVMITGVWLAGLIGVEADNYYSRYKNEGKGDPSTLWPAAEVAAVVKNPIAAAPFVENAVAVVEPKQNLPAEGDNTGARRSAAPSGDSVVDEREDSLPPLTVFPVASLRRRGASVGSDTSASGSPGSVGSYGLQGASRGQGASPSSAGQSRQGTPDFETDGVLHGTGHPKLPLPAQPLGQNPLRLSISADNLSSQTAESKAKAPGKLPSPTRARAASVPSPASRVSPASRNRFLAGGQVSPDASSSRSYTPPSATDTPSSSSGSPYMTGSPAQGKA